MGASPSFSAAPPPVLGSCSFSSLLFASPLLVAPSWALLDRLRQPRQFQSPFLLFLVS
jgi:hypothetical protein